MYTTPFSNLQIIESFKEVPWIWVIALFIILLTPANLTIKLLIRYIIFRMEYSVEQNFRIRPYSFGFSFLLFTITGGHYGLRNTTANSHANNFYYQMTVPGALEGILERSILFFLIVIGEYGAAAWVMLAKGFIIQGLAQREVRIQSHGTGLSGSIDVDRRNRIETAIYLIGTLASFSIAILGGIIFRNYLDAIHHSPVIVQSILIP